MTVVCQEPGFYIYTFGIYQDVLFQRGNIPIELEFHAPVVGARGGRQYLEDDAGVEKVPVVIVQCLQLTAYDGKIGIGKQAVLLYMNAQIGRKGLTVAAFKTLTQLVGKIICYAFMRLFRAGHCEDLTLVILVLFLLRGFPFEVFGN